jgi:hypothetical protein
MTLRRLFALASALLLASYPAAAAEGEFDRSGAYVTTNFRVTAPSKDLAEKFGDMAEHYRREKAIEWLGEPMPNWNQRCPLKVEIRMKDAGGATTFTFGGAGGRSGVLSQHMHIYGEQKQLLESVLPHEVTHTVLAYHFGQAVPRWADEGGSVLSENENECFEHDIRCREILNNGRGIKLRVLLTLKEYPRDMIVVYAQGYSICDYLINQHGGRTKFLKFVRTGMRNDNRNWEAAVRDVYGFESVDELEEKWIDSLRTPPQRVAKGKTGGTTALASRTSTEPEFRTSALSGVPKLEAPIVHRGAAPDREERARPLAKPASRTDDRPPPIPLLLPPEYSPRK